MQNLAPRPPKKAGWHNTSKDYSDFRSWLLHSHFLCEASVDMAAPSSQPPHRYYLALCSKSMLYLSLFFIPLSFSIITLHWNCLLKHLSPLTQYMPSRRGPRVYGSLLHPRHLIAGLVNSMPSVYVCWMNQVDLFQDSCSSFFSFLISYWSARSFPALSILRKAFFEPALCVRLPCLCFLIVQYFSHCTFHHSSFASGCMTVPLMPVSPTLM